MMLKRDMIVIDCNHRLPTNVAIQRPTQHLASFLCHYLARSPGELPSPQGIVKVLFARIRLGIERTQSSFDQLRACQMMVADHLSERSRSAMHHQTEPVLFVRLREGTARPISFSNWAAVFGFFSAEASTSIATASMSHPMSPPTAWG